MPTRSLLLFGATYVAAMLVAASTTGVGVLQSDVMIYEERLDGILSGHLPYLDAVFEHLPLSLIPLLAARLLANFVPGLDFTAALTVLNACALLGVLVVAGRLGEALEVDRLEMRWLVVAAPLFPLVLFRLDPVSLLLAALGLWGVAVGSRRLAVWGTVSGIAARGWPVVLVPGLWRRGWRLPAAGVTIFTVAMTVLLLISPGFVEGRAFEGVHFETMGGSLLLVARHATGDALGLFNVAGATYISAGWWVLVAHLGLGLVIAVTTLRRFKDDLALSLGLLTYALMLASPLLSAQFLLWPTLFIALIRGGPLRLVVVTGLLTTLMVAVWQPTEAWWAMVLLARNLALIATPLLLLRTVPTPTILAARQ